MHNLLARMSFPALVLMYLMPQSAKHPEEETLLHATIILQNIQMHLISTFFKGKTTLHLCSTCVFGKRFNSPHSI
jgi:hypothetical protein